MDIERIIEKIEIETDTNNNFDDLKITINNEEIYCQIKDIDNISLDDLKVEKNNIKIKNKKYALSQGNNILFLKNIKINPNSKILDFPSLKKENVYIISLSRENIFKKIDKKYQNKENRLPIICKFFENFLDERRLVIHRKDLPIIKIFSTKLLEKTIDIGKSHLDIQNLLHIEGKPGVGKSHLVNCLTKEYKNNIIYRFWISNQDKDYNRRLIYNNFISDISIKLFGDLVSKTEEEIIHKISNEGKVLIIDGFDHIENYNDKELNKYVDFINKVKDKCKTIVLSRPLKTKVKWEKQVLENWTKNQTLKVLDELYHIVDYKICYKIYDMTLGYPILVRYIAEHYKKFNNLPNLKNLKNLEGYYNKLIKNVNTRSALSLFISSHSFFMKSEIFYFLEDDFSNVVNEFISTYPYLFEIKLNRITLFHDSLNSYLKKNINNKKRIIKVNQKVFKSIMRGEKRFLSRFLYFDLDKDMKLSIIKKFSSIKSFKSILVDTIDFEAIRSFYFQIREALNELQARDLKIIHYYDLSLIINMVDRDHVSTLNNFFYTFVKCLIFNKYSEEDITSSEYLFSMFYYYKTGDSSLLYTITSNRNYDTRNFYNNLLYDVESEEHYFDIHKKPINLTKEIRNILNNKYEHESRKIITHILENIYINDTNVKEFKELKNAIMNYIETDEIIGIKILENILPQYNIRSFYAKIILSDVKNKIESLGNGKEPNKYRYIKLKDFILKYKNIGSFKMWVEILNYIRLSLKERREIDLSSISIFWPMYHERKDYSVINLDIALKAFEEKNFISEEKSIQLIVLTQSMSEKGIRHLLNGYIALHSPGILKIILNKYDIEDLEVNWFYLPTEFINSFSKRIFNNTMGKLLNYHHYSRNIEFEEIENTLNSKFWERIVRTLKIMKFKIKISESNPMVEKLKKFDIDLDFEPNNNQIKYKQNSIERYNQGILDSTDLNFIKKRNLSIADVSLFTDGYYSTLSDLDVYKIFKKEEVRKNIKTILYNSITAKVQRINMYGTLYYFLGNLPRLLVDIDFNEYLPKLFKSFKEFLSLSLLKID